MGRPARRAAGRRHPDGDRWAAAGLAVALATTVAVATALPGPRVGPIPATGLISVWPDAYLLLFALALAVSVGSHEVHSSAVPRNAGPMASIRESRG